MSEGMRKEMAMLESSRMIHQAVILIQDDLRRLRQIMADRKIIIELDCWLSSESITFYFRANKAIFDGQNYAFLRHPGHDYDGAREKVVKFLQMQEGDQGVLCEPWFQIGQGEGQIYQSWDLS